MSSIKINSTGFAISIFSAMSIVLANFTDFASCIAIVLAKSAIFGISTDFATSVAIVLAKYTVFENSTSCHSLESSQPV
jgi:hypothetical protein